VSQHSILGFPCHCEFFLGEYPVSIGCQKKFSAAVVPKWYFCSQQLRQGYEYLTFFLDKGVRMHPYGITNSTRSLNYLANTVHPCLVPDNLKLKPKKKLLKK
jgi:hypothetical protein